jgi:hypothetical protein
MAKDLEELCSKISLTDGEKVGINISEGEIAYRKDKEEHCLIGKIGNDRKINKEAFKSLLSCLWRTMGKVVFKVVLDNVWLFEFEDCEDKRHVIEGRQWSL